MGKLGGKVKNVATKTYAEHAFSSEDITRQAREGEHNGEPMPRVYARIQQAIADGTIKREETKKSGVYDLVYTSNDREAVVGWIDMNRGMGEISQKAYDHVQDLSRDGSYIIKKGEGYAVRAYSDELGKDGKYTVEDKNSEANPKFTFEDADYTSYPTYEDASHAAHEVSVQLGIVPSYDVPDYDDSKDSTIPSTGGYDPREEHSPEDMSIDELNGSCAHDMEDGFRL